jgi:uncharacterized protein YodC (DUF2158 family)
MADLKAGSTVKLKSGGPKMTVTNVGDLRGVRSVWVSWFDENKPAHAVFPVDAVEEA